MLRRLLPLLLATLLVVPGALALRASDEEVRIAYEAANAPLVLATGALHGEGALHDGVLAASQNGTRIGPIPRLTLVEGGGGSARVVEASDATILIHSGHLLWMLPNASIDATVDLDYGFSLTIPASPFDPAANDPASGRDADPRAGSDEAPRKPSLLFVGPTVRAELSSAGGPADLLPLDAVVSVLDAAGRPLAGWDETPVNADLDPADAQGRDGGGVVFRAEGAFAARIAAQALVAGLGGDAADLSVDIRAADEDLFLDTVAVLEDASALLNGDEASPSGGPPGASAALEALEALSGFLNGAVLLLPQPDEEGGPARESPEPRESTLGEEALDTEPFTVLRSRELAVAWAGDEMLVHGTSAVALTGQGFQTDAPLTLGPVPVLAALLWLAAVGAVVWFFVKRPPAAKGRIALRLMSTGVYVLALLVVFVLWDMSFADTFGTSVLTMLREKGLDGASYTQLALVFGLEMIPWSLAALLFALPVRIALGVALRYRGEGSSYKGLAKAGGLVSLAIFAPIYALWIVNVLLGQVLKLAPRLFAGG